MRQLPIAETLKSARQTLKSDPTTLFPILTRVRAPLYVALLEDCEEHDSEPLAHRAVKVLAHHCQHKKTGGVPLTPDQAQLLDTFCNFWGVPPQEAFAKILSLVGPELLEHQVAERQDQRKLMASANATRQLTDRK